MTSYAAVALRDNLLNELKTSMKNKDLQASTTIRSVLSEVYVADKTANEKVSSSVITAILRKAIARRAEAALQYADAYRLELSEKELQEVAILKRFVPPLMAEADIERILREVVADIPAETPENRKMGMAFKQFYAKVEKSAVDPDTVSQKLKAILAESS
ncbi:GatB/YqeY domain-containing protein [Fistulina hepatica ATCC 64428]|uniref:Altered inheritance of mitochondria protein 41 n=1 Tax=Fistulina hepatica ATCC 64428 TaxID=1128425 RepID=A0A0D7ADU2_9AGAR|nr:GatB/YqeY domain-containing protein [Fistulina hepatica ATCC 64428]